MIEKVGKITLDYSLYPGEDLYCDGDIEQEILKIVKEYPSVDFPKIIEKKGENDYEASGNQGHYPSRSDPHER